MSITRATVVLLFRSKLPKEVLFYLYEWIFCSFRFRMLNKFSLRNGLRIVHVKKSSLLLGAMYKDGFQAVRYSLQSGCFIPLSLLETKQLQNHFNDSVKKWNVTKFHNLWKRHGQTFHYEEDFIYLQFKTGGIAQTWTLPRTMRDYVPLADGRLAIHHRGGSLEIWG